MSIVEVRHVSKEFKLGTPTSFRTALGQLLRPAGRESPSPTTRFLALDDISLAIDAGEVVGIIGHNGAGKSTLLKLLSRISSPSRGSVRVRGRVAPLIEVGAGLVGELSGRENIFLNGAILGMSRREVLAKFDAIVAFSELEAFLDTPVKRYSSGMTVRLGFSIASSVDADILILDEVLAVGDIAFQRKCLDRVDGLIRDGGRTVLLVTHNIRQVYRMCTRALLLDHGQLIADGSPEKVCSVFYDQMAEKMALDRSKAASDNAKIESTGEVELLGIDVIDATGNGMDVIESSDVLRVRVRFLARERLVSPQFILGTHTPDFVYLSASSTGAFDDRPHVEPGEHEILLMHPSYPLVSGVYCIRWSVYDKNHRAVFVGESLKTFSIRNNGGELREPGARILDIPAEWKIDGKTLGSTDRASRDFRV